MNYSVDVEASKENIKKELENLGRANINHKENKVSVFNLNLQKTKIKIKDALNKISLTNKIEDEEITEILLNGDENTCCCKKK